MCFFCDEFLFFDEFFKIDEFFLTRVLFFFFDESVFFVVEGIFW